MKAFSTSPREMGGSVWRKWQRQIEDFYEAIQGESSMTLIFRTKLMRIIHYQVHG